MFSICQKMLPSRHTRNSCIKCARFSPWGPEAVLAEGAKAAGRSQGDIRHWNEDSPHFRRKEGKWLKRLLFSVNGSSNLKAVYVCYWLSKPSDCI